MKTEKHIFFVKSQKPPIVEIDSQAASVYVRFKSGKIAKTVAQPCETMHVAVDLDSDGDVIGVEAVGITEFTIQFILKQASVKAPAIAVSRARYVPAELVCA
jgi:uncharacterized protein YuzE